MLDELKSVRKKRNRETSEIIKEITSIIEISKPPKLESNSPISLPSLHPPNRVSSPSKSQMTTIFLLCRGHHIDK